MTPGFHLGNRGFESRLRYHLSRSSSWPRIPASQVGDGGSTPPRDANWCSLPYANGMEHKKTCQGCGEDDQDKLVTFKRRGKVYRRGWCGLCYREKKNLWRAANQDSIRRSRELSNRRRRERRARGENLQQIIWNDSRESDKKKGRENDLTKEFIAEQIAKGCSYCGETELRMTLDRIDNGIGHLQANVVPACIRCNYVRGNMPHKAWVVVARAMKRARKQELFGDWTGRAR